MGYEDNLDIRVSFLDRLEQKQAALGRQLGFGQHQPDRFTTKNLQCLFACRSLQHLVLFFLQQVQEHIASLRGIVNNEDSFDFHFVAPSGRNV